MGRPRDGRDIKKSYGVRLEPKFKNKVLEEFGSLRQAIEFAMEYKIEIKKRKDKQDGKNNFSDNAKRTKQNNKKS